MRKHAKSQHQEPLSGRKLHCTAVGQERTMLPGSATGEAAPMTVPEKIKLMITGGSVVFS